MYPRQVSHHWARNLISRYMLGAGEVNLWVKISAIQPDGLNLIPQTHTAEEKIPANCPLPYTCVQGTSYSPHKRKKWMYKVSTHPFSKFNAWGLKSNHHKKPPEMSGFRRKLVKKWIPYIKDLLIHILTYINMESMTKFWAIVINWMYRKECYLSPKPVFVCLEFLSCISFTYFVCVMEASIEVRGQLEGVGFLLVHPVSHSPTLLLRSSNVYRVSISSSLKIFFINSSCVVESQEGQTSLIAVCHVCLEHLQRTHSYRSSYLACLWFFVWGVCLFVCLFSHSRCHGGVRD